MGGKQRQAQRTKGNARPSSSGRSAELLVGFSGKEAGFKLPGFSLCPVPTEDLDSALDSNMQLVLKKMSKKDATTKLKALQEFAESIKSADEETVKLVLAPWSRLYCNLATDVEHRVREAAHLAHHAVVLKAKRNLAPFLKQLSGPWFTSQYDTYAPAASAAEQAFQNAFPPNKLQEAIVFCQEEILTYIYDNIVVHTAQTLSNPKVVSVEDAEAKYQRVLIASLQGYALYLSKVPTEQIQNAAELNSKIVNSAKFWKLSKNKVSAIRAAWFNVLTQLSQKGKFLLENEAEHVTPAVMTNLDESEPLVLPYVWECALLLNSTINEWSKFINVEKVVLPKLWKVLKEGGQGNASVVFPNLLPLISHFPALSDMKLFYKTFFDNIRIGLKHKTVIVSRSEASAVAIAFTECLRYIILKNSSDIELCEDLIKNQLLQVIEWSLTEEHIAAKTLYTHISTLVQYWSKNRNSEEHCNYSKYVTLFWDNLETIFINVIKSTEFKHETDNLGEIASRQIELLLSLQRIGIASSKKQMKVKFISTETLESGDTGHDQAKSVNLDEFYLMEIKILAYKTCRAYVDVIDEKKCKDLIVHLYSLALDFDNVMLFEHLNKSYQSGDSGCNLINIYNKLFSRWLQSKILCSQPVVELIFLLFKYLDEAEKDIILDSFLKNNSKECLNWCIAKALVYPHNEDEKVQLWLSHEKVSSFLEEIAQAQLDDTTSVEQTLLLKQAFTENSEGKLFVSKDACMKIVKIFNRALLNPSDYPITIDSCASFAAYLSANLYTESSLLDHGEDLLLALFTLSCITAIDPEILSQDTIWEVNTAWQDVVSTIATEIPQETFNALTAKFADIVQQNILSDNCDTAMFDRITTVMVDFLKAAMQDFNSENISDFYYTFAKRPQCINEWKKTLTDVCVVTDLILGNLSSPWKQCTNCISEFDSYILVKYLRWSHLCVNVLNFLKFSNDDDEDIDEEDEHFETFDDGKNCKLKQTTKELNCIIADVVMSCAVAQNFLENYKNINSYREVEKQYNSIVSKLKEVVTNLNEQSLQDLTYMITSRAEENCWMDTKAFYIFNITLLNRSVVQIYKSIIKGEKSNQSLLRLHSTQIFGKFLEFENLQLYDILPVESLINLRTVIIEDHMDVSVAEAFGAIEKFKSENNEALFYEANIANANWSVSQVVVEIIRFLTMLVEKKSSVIPKKYWDFIIISTAGWITSISKCNLDNMNIETTSFVIAAIRLYCAVFNHINHVAKTEGHTSLVLEWNDVFLEDIHIHLLKTWIYFANKYVSDVPFSDLKFLECFGRTTSYLNHRMIFEKLMPEGVMLVPLCCKLITCSAHVLQLWGYHMLMGIIPGLVILDTVAVDTNVPQKEGLILERFKDILFQTEDVVQTMLLDFRLGDSSCRVQPFTDAYTYTFGYLCVWDILLKFCEKSSTELCFQYADWLKNGNYIEKLLNNVFRLMPGEILHYADGKNKPLVEYFTTKPPLVFEEACNSELLEHLTCQIYVGCVEKLPAVVRQWWSATESRLAQLVDRVTTAYVSPQLCYQELNYIAQCQTKFKNMTIKVHQSVREVVAIYTVDEAQMELVITLPTNYPLGGPNVECIRQIGGTSCRHWLMQLKMCVLHQNGRIWDGLSLWNANLNKKFDGVEECYICFAVLHPGTYQLPKLSCKTCRKKFHSACLYKWFSTSNKSTCPICRNLF